MTTLKKVDTWDEPEERALLEAFESLATRVEQLVGDAPKEMRYFRSRMSGLQELAMSFLRGERLT